MGDFMAFRRMITPVIIQILFWVGVVVSVAVGLGLIANGSGSDRLMAVGILVGGPVVARIYCELLILLFRMNEALDDIRTSLTPSHE